MIDRYACPSIDTIWTLLAQLRRWEQVERAASEVTGHPLASLPVDWSGPWLSRYHEFEARYGHDLAAFVETLRQHEKATASDDAARWLHYGLCSSDVVDAGWLIGMRDVTATLGRLVIQVEIALETNALPQAVLYRTHGQAAQVAPGDARWNGLSEMLLRAHRAMNYAASDRFDGLLGPTGTGGEFTDDQRERFCDQLGLSSGSDRHGRQVADRTEWVTWLQSVARLATVCERIATQVRLLAQTGIDEVREPTGVNEYRGSSSMPHKRNPTRSERICGLAPIVRGLANGYAEAASSVWDAHSLEHSSAERIAIPQVTSLTGYILTETAQIANGLEFDEGASRRNADLAPADSYIERNRLIREGVDGGQAWVQARNAAPVELARSHELDF